SVSGCPVHTNRLGCGRHAVVHHPRRFAKHQQLIGCRVISPLRPSLQRGIDVGNTTCLLDRCHAAFWPEDNIKHLAGRYALGLSWRADLTVADLSADNLAADNLGVRFSMQRGQAILLREFRRELGGRHHRLLIRARLRDHDLRRSARLGTLQLTAVFHDEVHHWGGHLDVLCVSLRWRRRYCRRTRRRRHHPSAQTLLLRQPDAVLGMNRLEHLLSGRLSCRLSREVKRYSSGGSLGNLCSLSLSLGSELHVAAENGGGQLIPRPGQEQFGAI